MPETITSRDAARFPIIASCTLFGLYLFFKVTWGFPSLPPGAFRWENYPQNCISHPDDMLDVCFDVGIFSRVHQPAAVCLLLRPGRPGSVSHHEVKLTQMHVMWNIISLYLCVIVGHVANFLLLSLSFSPLMSRIFPASFPNKQFQLLFTQGSGESKEGETCCSALKHQQTVHHVHQAPQGPKHSQQQSSFSFCLNTCFLWINTQLHV